MLTGTPVLAAFKQLDYFGYITSVDYLKIDLWCDRLISCYSHLFYVVVNVK